MTNNKKPAFALRSDVLSDWRPIKAGSEANTLSIYDAIGEDYYGDGWGLKKVEGILRNMSGDITVKINSPGGDFFEGLAIYNALRAYDGKVTVKIMGIAASAASIIAMAGDEIEIGKTAYLMIHNAWTIAIGNKDDLSAIVKDLDVFDTSMHDVYADRVEGQDIKKMMDDETYIRGQDAVDMGFATSLFEVDKAEIEPAPAAKEIREIEAGLMMLGKTRSQRRDTLSRMEFGKPSAVDEVKPSADELAELNALILIMKP